MILVIGGSGQLAQSLQKAGGDCVEAAGRPGTDLLDTDSLFDTFDRIRPDAVVNTAAYTAVDQAETEALTAQAINNEGAGRLAAICRAKDIPLIHISTDFVFDGQTGAPYRESDATNPINEYGKSKLDGERAVRAANQDALILRTAWVHSPFGANFTKTMMGLLRSREDIKVVDDQFGSPTYAPHLASGVLALVDKVLASGDPDEKLFHLAGAGHASRLEWVTEIADVLTAKGHPAARIMPTSSDSFPTPARRPPDTRLDCSLIDEAFGIALPDWRDGVRACVTALLDDEGGRS